ncbi:MULTISPECIES: hypothetical protein [unclassified Methanosarcina]|uniref:hypothetical protein n=1 Tax=unclassified Methanosarcina TaxID=2644672 RepID=UPI0012E06CBE|nr:MULTISPECIES: hypothetical protein [unclassified Methanosarcina]
MRKEEVLNIRKAIFFSTFQQKEFLGSAVLLPRNLDLFYLEIPTGLSIGVKIISG